MFIHKLQCHYVKRIVPKGLFISGLLDSVGPVSVQSGFRVNFRVFHNKSCRFVVFDFHPVSYSCDHVARHPIVLTSE